MVLMQLVAPGAPTFYSIVASVMDPRSGEYINAIAEKYLCHVAGVQIAHAWGVPILGGAFGAQHAEAASWQHGRDSVYNALMVPLAGAPRPDIGSRARAKLDAILAGHRPKPLEKATQTDLRQILNAAKKELGT